MVEQLFDYLKENYFDKNITEKANLEFERLFIRNAERF